MIKGFEALTKELTDYEFEKTLPELVKLLKTAKGKKSAMTNKFLIFTLSKNGVKVTQPRVRKLIQYIRITGIIERLIATSKGYYISDDPLELRDYVDSLMQRASSIEQLAKQMSYQTDIRFHKGQKSIF